MAKVEVYNLSGDKVKDLQLPDSIFAVPVKAEVVHQVVVALQSNKRQPWAHTKDRSEVSGGGKKPWRQKGTGRARHGSIRSPIWVGGGVTFGPRKDVNYTKKVNKKVKRLALFMTLSDRVAEQALKVIDKLAVDEIKTKLFTQSLEKLSLAGKKVLLVLDKDDDSKVFKSARNLPKVQVIKLENLNILDILANEYLLISEQALNKLIALYQKNN